MTREPGWYWCGGEGDWEPALWSEKGWSPALSVSMAYLSDEQMVGVGPRIPEPAALAAPASSVPDRAQLVEELELARHVRRMVRAENVHARGLQSDRKAGREDGSSTSRDDVDMIHADLYAAFPAKRLDALIAALSAALPTGEA